MTLLNSKRNGEQFPLLHALRACICQCMQVYRSVYAGKSEKGFVRFHGRFETRIKMSFFLKLYISLPTSILTLINKMM